jgi:hypothetical protein
MESRIRFATVFIVLGLFILLFLVSLLGMFLSFLIMPGTLGGGADSSFAEGLRLWAVGITATASAITALGAISTAIIGWRGDRREAKEANLRVARLEKELEEIKAKNESVPV